MEEPFLRNLILKFGDPMYTGFHCALLMYPGANFSVSPSCSVTQKDIFLISLQMTFFRYGNFDLGTVLRFLNSIAENGDSSTNIDTIMRKTDNALMLLYQILTIPNDFWWIDSSICKIDSRIHKAWLFLVGYGLVCIMFSIYLLKISKINFGVIF